LPDTHLLVWWAGFEANESSPLPPVAAELMDDEANDIWFSAASIWEVAIKTALGRADFALDPSRLRRGLLDSGYEELAVTGEHAVGVSRLPPLHKDPFDRLLIAQATIEGLTLLTSDAAVAAYAGPIRRV
jgi:PIN domain nuclease of toxin-antitoxin system